MSEGGYEIVERLKGRLDVHGEAMRPGTASRASCHLPVERRAVLRSGHRLNPPKHFVFVPPVEVAMLDSPWKRMGSRPAFLVQWVLNPKYVLPSMGNAETIEILEA